MRKWLCILLLSVGCQAVVLAENWGVEHENVLSVRYGGMWMQDQYLSPLLYSGQQVGLSNEWWQGFKKESAKNWEHVGKMDVGVAWMYNETYTNVIYSLGLQGGWGACYNWSFADYGLRVKLGPYMDVDLMGKLHGVSVNKPYSMDISLNMCALGGFSWAFKAKKTSYRLRYMAQVNVLGMDYLPDYWQSYYEMGEGVLGNVRCAGLWNHRHLQHELAFDMQFKRSTWRVGIEHEYLEYGDKKMMFSRETVSAVVGCVWQYKIRPTMRNYNYEF